MRIRDRAWAAGIIDGEGTVTLSRVDSVWRTAVVSVPSTSHELLVEMKRIFGGFISQRNSEDAKGWKRSWVWAVRSHRALHCLAAVMDFLVESRKKSRAKFILGNYLKVTQRNGKYSPSQAVKKEKFEARFFAL